MQINLLLLFVGLVCLLSCKNEGKQTSFIQPTTIETIVPKIVVDYSALKLDPNKGKWYYKKEPFSGFAIKKHSNDTLAEKIGFYEGKKQGIAKKWFNNKQLKREAFYNQNRLNGVSRTWWPNGAMASESNHNNGVTHGIQKKWYPNGQIAKQTTIHMGKEEGLQKAWLKNGKLYVNYEAKNGRIYGLRRSSLCYELKDEVIIRNE